MRGVKTMLTYIQRMTKELIDDYEVTTAYDEKRKAYAIEKLNRDIELSLNGENTDDGLYGKVFELFSHTPMSTITTFRRQGVNDCYIVVDGKRRKAEVKTNCGRIGNLYEMPISERKARYIIYTICRVKPEGKHVKKDGTKAPAEEWYLAPIVMRISDFLEIVEKYNAIRMIEHSDYVESDLEPSLKADKAKFYNALSNRKSAYYERFATYTKAEIK